MAGSLGPKKKIKVQKPPLPNLQNNLRLPFYGCGPRHPPPPPFVGPNFSHHKARVQAVGWSPLGIKKQGSRLFAAPPPPPTRIGTGPKAAPPPPPPACPCTHTSGRHMLIEVPPLTDRQRTPKDEYVGICDPHDNPARGPPLPNK